MSGRAAALRSFVLGACAVVLGLLFVMAALGRRLNFDEPLALRSGWLLWERIDAAPSFYMPFTLALGALGHMISDPGTVFLVARLICVLAVVAAVVFVSRSKELNTPERWVFLTLVFGSGAFASHAFEFRYDTAILVALLLSLVWLARDAGPRFVLLGASAAWLSMHHLKGVFFAAALLVLVVEAMRRRPGEWRDGLLRLGAGFAGAWVLWVGLSVALGFGGDLVATYATFFELASEQPKVWPWKSLERYLVKDIAWWLIAVSGMVLWLLRARSAGRSILRSSLGFSAATLAFLFVHPYPLPYLLAACVPFVALSAARGLETQSPWLAPVAALVVTGVALAPGSAYVRALSAPRTPEVASLRWLQQAADPADRVFDPSGLAYFLPPCLDEWYLDSLFSLRAVNGAWMTALEDFPDPERPCVWLVNTYRASSVPRQYQERVANHFVLVVPGVALAQEDPRRKALDSGQAASRQLPSYWW